MKPQQVRMSSGEQDRSWRQQEIEVKEMIELFPIVEMLSVLSPGVVKAEGWWSLPGTSAGLSRVDNRRPVQ